MVTAVAVAALLAGARHPRTAGALAAFGAMLKVWPGLLLLGTPRGSQTRTVWTAALVTGGRHPGLLRRDDAGRVRVPRLPARPEGPRSSRWARWSSMWHGTSAGKGEVLLNYGSMEFIGPQVNLVSDAALVLTRGRLRLAAAVAAARRGMDAVHSGGRGVHGRAALHDHQPRHQPAVHDLAGRSGSRMPDAAGRAGRCCRRCWCWRRPA